MWRKKTGNVEKHDENVKTAVLPNEGVLVAEGCSCHVNYTGVALI